MTSGRFVRTETVRGVMAATRCAVFVFKRVYYIPLPASGMDRVAGMVADWFSLHERLIFQSVSKKISLQLEEKLERDAWNSLEADSWSLLCEGCDVVGCDHAHQAGVAQGV